MMSLLALNRSVGARAAVCAWRVLGSIRGVGVRAVDWTRESIARRTFLSASDHGHRVRADGSQTVSVHGIGSRQQSELRAIPRAGER